jgi:hypothetical protein
MRESRGSWYLLTGLILGVAAGVLYAWLVSPVHYVNTAPSSMSSVAKDRYRSLIALAYAADGDLGRARVRLALLHDADGVQVLAAQAQRTIADGGETAEARALAVLASALGNEPVQPVAISATAQVQPTTQPALSTPLPSSTPSPTPFPPSLTPTLSQTPGLTQIIITASPTLTRTATPLPPTQTTATRFSTTRETPSPTPTATATPGRPFVVKDRSQVCDPTRPHPLLQVDLIDAAGHPVPGVELLVAWQGGEDHFFTGLKPDIDLGYADYVMSPDITYSLRLLDGGQPITGIKAPQCTDQNGQVYWGGWSFRLAQP